MSDFGKTLVTAAAGVALVAGFYAVIAVNGKSSVPTAADWAAVKPLLSANSIPATTPDQRAVVVAAAKPAAPVAAAPAAKPATAPTQVAAATPAPAAPAAAPAAAASAPAAPAASGGAPDPAAGKVVFAKCKACHTVTPDGKNGVGPGLYGVINRPVASIVAFKYSDSMKGKGGTWTAVEISNYLKDPKGAVKGNKMAFAGLPSEADRANVIAYLAQNSATPIAPADLGLAGGAAPAAAPAAAAAAAPAAPAPTADAAAAPAADAAAAPAADPAANSGVVYTDPPPPTPEELAKENEAVAVVMNSLPTIDYERARYSPLHFKPMIDKATNGECLACHQEILGTNVSPTSPAGVQAADSLAWYQTLATYQGDQQTFHQRHLTSAYATQVMDLKCNFCHQGNDPREESPHATVAPGDMLSNNGQVPFTNRKMVNVSETCLRCHGAMPDPVNIMGLTGPWPEARVDLENEETPNGCLTCHADLYRTNRHNVTYLKAQTIEELGKLSSDTCYGCHGGRSWYRISYPYPRHAWPSMDASTTPDWAKGRPTQSDARYQRPETK